MAYSAAAPFLPALHQQVRRDLFDIVRSLPGKPALLDVGGRKSHYTVGLRADVVVSDIPRESGVQEELHLGVTDSIVAQTLSRRSNIRSVVIDDMTQSKLPDAAYDVVAAIEVLEHVDEDSEFVRQVKRVLRPGGVFYMTTPNGETVPNRNADHKRHYTRQQLEAKLREWFSDVDVYYGIETGKLHHRSIRSWNMRHPIETVVTMAAGALHGMQSRQAAIREQPHGTHHLFAVARKPR
ncbi:MAG: methyltransferase domain-containing protein [Bryobacteraceae bacterium]